MVLKWTSKISCFYCQNVEWETTHIMRYRIVLDTGYTEKNESFGIFSSWLKRVGLPDIVERIFWEKSKSLPSSYFALLKGIDRPFREGVKRSLIRSLFKNWRLGNFFSSHFKWISSQDQQKTKRRRLIISKVTLTGQSHLMRILVLRKATLQNRINSVPWMTGVTPTPYHECTQLVWMKVAWRSRQTACIHGTELVWPRSFMVQS